jgi:hypothetical protein
MLVFLKLCQVDPSLRLGDSDTLRPLLDVWMASTVSFFKLVTFV